MLNKVQKYFLATVTMATLFASPTFADDADTALDDVEHFTDILLNDFLRLEEVEVTGRRGGSDKLDDLGAFTVIPRLVVEDGTRRTAYHGGYGLIIRPVIEGDGDLYKLDTSRGRTHYTINSGLPKRSKPDKIRVSGSKRFIPVDRDRRLRLPEGRYAIAEVYYFVARGPSGTWLSQTGSGPGGQAPPSAFNRVTPEIKRYCLSETTLSFEVNAGETTSLDKLYLRGLPFRSRQWRDHDPIFGADAGIVKAGQIAFTKEAEDAQNWIPIAFDADSGMCSNQSAVRTTGWDIPNPEEWNLPVSYDPTYDQGK